MIPNTYRIQDSCINCKHVFRKCDYDDPYTYFCNITNDRPPCNSMAMAGEHNAFTRLAASRNPGGDGTRAAFKEALDRWDNWAENREVAPNGICLSYERRSS